MDLASAARLASGPLRTISNVVQRLRGHLPPRLRIVPVVFRCLWGPKGGGSYIQLTWDITPPGEPHNDVRRAMLLKPCAAEGVIHSELPDLGGPYRVTAVFQLPSYKFAANDLKVKVRLVDRFERQYGRREVAHDTH